jgi:hypothetical protein
MSRKFLDDIRADITSQMPDNNVGLVTPAIVRGIMRDIVDSTTEDVAFIYRTGGPLTSYARTTTAALLPNLFDANYLATNMDGVTTQDAAGTITLGNIAGRQYTGTFNITFEAANGTEVQAGLFLGGVLSPLWGAAASVVAANRQVTITMPWYINKSIASQVIGPALWLPNGAGTIDVTALQFSCSIMPTNNP